MKLPFLILLAAAIILGYFAFRKKKVTPQSKPQIIVKLDTIYDCPDSVVALLNDYAYRVQNQDYIIEQFQKPNPTINEQILTYDSVSKHTAIDWIEQYRSNGHNMPRPTDSTGNDK